VRGFANDFGRLPRSGLGRVKEEAMMRFLQFGLVLLVFTPIVGCVSAKDRLAEQQEVERSLRKTSNPKDVEGCDFVMMLRPDGIHKTPEAQAASLVLSRPGVGWVVLEAAGISDLYSCRLAPSAPPEKTLTPTPAEIAPAPAPVAQVEATVTPAHTQSLTRPPEAKATPEPPKRDASRTRVTSNPEAIKGCKFLASFASYRRVSQFQEDVLKSGGNIGYVVASNQDGDVIGESYLCPGEPNR
jgi:hypothetical protein